MGTPQHLPWFHDQIGYKPKRYSYPPSLKRQLDFVGLVERTNRHEVGVISKLFDQEEETIEELERQLRVYGSIEPNDLQ